MMRLPKRHGLHAFPTIGSGRRWTAFLRSTFVIAVGLFLATVSSKAQTELSVLDKPLALFFEIKFQQALPLFEQIVEKDPKNAEARTWLAETYRRMGKIDEAIENARKALSLNPRSSFAHIVIAQASYPNNDTVLAYVKSAIECDSTDPNAWLMMWGEAIRHADPALRNKTLRKLVETGFFTKASLAYGRAELRNLPPDAILITNGDMDTYPAQAVQVSEGFRTDVAVIERGHLDINWGCRFVRDHQNVPLPVSDTDLDSMKDTTDTRGQKLTKSDQIFRGWVEQKLRGDFQRPIALAPTVEETFYDWNKEHFHYRGMYFLWQAEKVGRTRDTAAIRECLDGIDPDEFTGPWASLKDRSPVRRYYTKGIVRVLSRVALTYSIELMRAKRFADADQTLRWLEVFEKRTELGEVSTNEIQELRKLLNR